MVPSRIIILVNIIEKLTAIVNSSFRELSNYFAIINKEEVAAKRPPLC